MAILLNILGLSVAFAAFMIIMMQVDYDYNFDRYHSNGDCIYRVEISYDKSDGSIPMLARPIADAIIDFSPHIEAGALYIPHPSLQYFTVETEGERNGYEEIFVRVYPSVTEVFEFKMLEGTGNSLEDPEKVLLPESLAKKIFGDQSAVGSILKRDNKNLTVGGVYKDFPSNSALMNGVYIPIPKSENKDEWGQNAYSLYIRLDRPESADHLIDDFKAKYEFPPMAPDMLAFLGEVDYRLSPLTDLHFIQDTSYDPVPKASEQTLFVLMAIAFIIVAIAAINYTNFSSALAPMRIKGINTQKVLGEENKNIRITLLLEAISINMIAYLASLLLVLWAGHTFVGSLVDTSLALTDYPGIVAGTALIALLTGFLSGLYPSYYMTSFEPAMVLQGSFGLSPKGRKMRSTLIGLQFIASFTLIIVTSFMSLQNLYMQRAPLGYDKDELIVTNINNTIRDKQEAFTSQLKAFSGVEDVAYGAQLLSNQQRYSGLGRNYRDGMIYFQCLGVSHSFLKVVGIPVTDGRDFRQEDDLTSALIFNETARKQYDMQLGEKIDEVEVVGFMPDIKFATFHVEVAPMAFFVEGDDSDSGARYAYIRVKAGTDMHAAFTHIEKTLSQFDPDYPFNIRFYDQVMDRTYKKERNMTYLISLFGLIAIFISIVGVFGLVVFDSECRTKEIGVRKTLGSTTVEILLLFNKTYIRILALCFVIATPIAWYIVSKWFENFAYNIPMYWWVFAIAFIVVTLITVFTVTYQNWQTANLNPVDSIKRE